VFDSLTHYVTNSAWTYLILFALAVADSVIPLVPSETAVILAGVLAANGNLNLVLVVLAAALGAVAGDNLAYGLGRKAGPWIHRRFSSDKAKGRLDWARALLERRGVSLVVLARFIPGGRTVVSVSAGMLHMAHLRFFAATVVAGALWGTYAAMLGYFGGRAFEDEPWKGFALAFAVALLLMGVVEAIRWAVGKRRSARAATG
jgi:membrane-associated protein